MIEIAKKKYSNNIIKIILDMVNIDEKLRPQYF
jgi:hypothetical protein